ncbi:hypothetical protein CBM2589_U10163 [Cupriavidus taiwanensis]|uniref:Uncharacterized protein n=1 Tax=Cupriavidus taiwanensis TaxID=164546 RepID=A0A375CRD6_9BURK|nr:hypothetical protein CBM2589_U10163 [Cupriavidus taiwanensis]
MRMGESAQADSRMDSAAAVEILLLGDAASLSLLGRPLYPSPSDKGNRIAGVATAFPLGVK